MPFSILYLRLLLYSGAPKAQAVILSKAKELRLPRTEPLSRAIS
jgi:hypothetical protein